MPPSKKAKKAAKTIDFCLLPLSTSNFGSQSEIDARMGTPGQWKTVATVYSVPGADAEDVANQIIDAMNTRPEIQKLLHEMAAFLKAQIEKNALPEDAAKQGQDLLARVQEYSAV